MGNQKQWGRWFRCNFTEHKGWHDADPSDVPRHVASSEVHSGVAQRDITTVRYGCNGWDQAGYVAALERWVILMQGWN